MLTRVQRSAGSWSSRAPPAHIYLATEGAGGERRGPATAEAAKARSVGLLFFSFSIFFRLLRSFRTFFFSFSFLLRSLLGAPSVKACEGRTGRGRRRREPQAARGRQPGPHSAGGPGGTGGGRARGSGRGARTGPRGAQARREAAGGPRAAQPRVFLNQRETGPPTLEFGGLGLRI